MAFIPSIRRKGLGLKFEDGPSDTDGLEAMRLSAEHIPLDFMDHEKWMPWVGGKPFVFDQGATSSCVMNAFGHGIILKEARENLPFDLPSRRYGYYNARREHGSHLVDAGTYLRTCAHGIRKQGVCSEKHWPWSQFGFKLNRRPNWNAMRMAHPRRGGKYVRIFETGEDRVKAVQQAILNGHDVAFGTRIGASFQGQGDYYINLPPLTEKIIGGHAMLIIGWKTSDIDGLYFRVLNSWGNRWRDGGLCWMSEAYIRWPMTSDLHVIHGWERVGDTE